MMDPIAWLGRSVRGRWVSLLVGLVACLGCGRSGPEKYPLSGKITFDGKPVVFGDIRFEPKEGLNNSETIGFARFRDGSYSTEVVGGPHWVYIRDLTGDVDMSGGESTEGKALFQMQYRAEIDLPTADQVQGTATKDIEVPRTHK